MVANNNTLTVILWSILEKDKLNKTNFLDWSWNLKIVLKQERKRYVLDTTFSLNLQWIPKSAKNAYNKYLSDSMDATYFMLIIMVLETMKAFDMMSCLKECSKSNFRHERFLTIETLNSHNGIIIVHKGKGKANQRLLAKAYKA